MKTIDLDLVISMRSAVINMRRLGAWYMAEVFEKFIDEYVRGE